MLWTQNNSVIKRLWCSQVTVHVFLSTSLLRHMLLVFEEKRGDMVFIEFPQQVFIKHMLLIFI